MLEIPVIYNKLVFLNDMKLGNTGEIGKPGMRMLRFS